MIAHSNTFKQKINEFGRELDSVIHLYADDTTSSYTEITNDKIFSAKLITNGELFSTLMKELDFESSEDLTIGNVVRYKLGVKIDDIQGTYEYLDYGKFIINKKEFDESKKVYIYTCYDYMLKTMQKLSNTFIELWDPTIIVGNNPGSLIGSIYTTVFGTDWSYVYTNLQTFETNENEYIYDLKELLKNNMTTYRDVLDFCCKLLGVNMYFKENANTGRMTLYYVGLGNVVTKTDLGFEYQGIDASNVTIVDTFDNSFIRKQNSTFKDKFGPINRLIANYGNNKTVEKKDDSSITQNGETLITFDGLPAFSSDSQTDYDFGKVFAIIKGMNFNLCDFDSSGICYLEWLDYFNIVIDEVTYKCLLLNSEITIKNGITEKIYTDMPVDNTQEYISTEKSSRTVSAPSVVSQGNAYANGEKLVQESELTNMKSEMLDLFYPVGSYYETSNASFNPNTAWGGTWVEDTKGKVTVAKADSGTFATLGSNVGSDSKNYTPAGTNTGGAVQSHTLTTDEMPSHRHLVSSYAHTYASGTSPMFRAMASSGSTGHDYVENSFSDYQGGNGGHSHGFTQPTFNGTQASINVIQSSIVVKRWHRTA